MKICSILALSLLLPACNMVQEMGLRELEKLREPKVSLQSIKLGSSNIAEQKFLVNLRIDNPNVQSIKANDIELALAINGQGIAKGLTSQVVEIRGNSTSEVEVAVVANAIALLQQGLLMTSNGAKSVPYQITGQIGLLNGILKGIKIPISYSGSINTKELMKGSTMKNLLSIGNKNSNDN